MRKMKICPNCGHIMELLLASNNSAEEYVCSNCGLIIKR